MKLSNKQIVTFVKVTNNMTQKKMPLKLSFALKRNRQLAEDAARPYNEELVNILNEHKDDSGMVNALVNELLNETVELEMKTVPVDIIEKTDEEGYDHLTLGELEAIDFMIEG